MIDKIYKVKVWVGETHASCNATEINVTEKDKTFVTDDNKRIDKGKLMKIDTIFYENSDSIRYHTYCLENDIESAKQMLLSHVESKIVKYKESLNSTISQFNLLKENLKNDR